MRIDNLRHDHCEKIVTTECHGGDPNNTTYENDVHVFL